MPSKRDSILETSTGLIRLLASDQPVGMVAILQEVAMIERDALTLAAMNSRRSRRN